MGKKLLILSASPRMGGNSDILCDQFIKGAQEAGHQAEKIYVKDQKINYCIACDACQKNGGKCVHKDDMAEIAQRMIDADVVVLATPIYFYSMDAQLKTLIDRSYARFMEMAGKDFYYILTGAADGKEYMDIAISGLHGFVICVPGAKEKGIVYGVGAGEKGTIKATPAMQEAYEMGKGI